VSAIDLEARARALLDDPRWNRFAGPGADVRLVAEYLAAVALEAGDAVQAAHRHRLEARETYHDNQESAAGAMGIDASESYHRAMRRELRAIIDGNGVCDPDCLDCGGTGVADAAVVLGLERPR
jgi:hypothetical protein